MKKRTLLLSVLAFWLLTAFGCKNQASSDVTATPSLQSIQIAEPTPIEPAVAQDTSANQSSKSISSTETKEDPILISLANDLGISDDEKLDFYAAIRYERDGVEITSMPESLPLSLIASSNQQDLYITIGTLYEGTFEHYEITVNPIKKDLSKAFTCYERAAELGSAIAKLKVGDMLFDGIGVPQDQAKAVEIYLALEGRASYIYSRLAEAYSAGSGVSQSDDKVLDYTVKGALEQEPAALFALAVQQSESNGLYLFGKAESLLRAAAFAIDWSYDIEEVASWRSGFAKNPKSILADLSSALEVIWCNSSNAKSSPHNASFPKEAVEVLRKWIYTSHVTHYGDWQNVPYNKNKQDFRNIDFADFGSSRWGWEDAFSVEYKSDDQLFYYEYDFDGDGELELCFITHPGAGGAQYSYYTHQILKKNDQGLYDYAEAYAARGNDGGFLMQHGDLFFYYKTPEGWVTEPTHRIEIEAMAKNAEQACLTVAPKDFKPTLLVASAAGGQLPDPAFLKTVDKQAKQAIKASRSESIYRPKNEQPLAFQPRWEEGERAANADMQFAKSDIDNDGKTDYFQRIRFVNSWNDGFFNEYLQFDVFHDQASFESLAGHFSDYEEGVWEGRTSKGNVSKLFPVRGNIAQFWTLDWEGSTYCLVLTRNDWLYNLDVFCRKNNVSNTVLQSLYFDEPQTIEASFSKDFQ